MAKPTAQMATVRLVAGPGSKDGRYAAGIDLTMAPGSHTYWKNPGEAGVPPVFAFNGSNNVAGAEVLFPVPSRISEEGIEAYGYTGQVVFPVRVTPAERGRPSVLHLDMTYAVCAKICMPAHSEATLTLAPGESGGSSALVAAALAQVPRPATPEQKADLALTPDAKAAQPTWTLTWRGKSPPSDIFATAPEGYFFATKKLGADRWSLVAAQSVSTADAPSVPMSLVLSRPEGPLRVEETLDVRPRSR